jgi:hypothetical protein
MYIFGCLSCLLYHHPISSRHLLETPLLRSPTTFSGIRIGNFPDLAPRRHEWELENPRVYCPKKIDKLVKSYYTNHSSKLLFYLFCGVLEWFKWLTKRVKHVIKNSKIDGPLINE